MMMMIRAALAAAADFCLPITRHLLLAATLATQFLLSSTVAQAGTYEPVAVPLRQFGFATAGHVQLPEDFIKFYDYMHQVLGDGGIVRTGLVWDPTRSDVPNFARWSAKELELARTRNILVLPVITTNNLTQGGYRMPTDAQWTYGLRQIVQMYGPNGIYQRGGSYVFMGKTTVVAPHPTFPGLTDFELWNEPNDQGNLNGAMTPARVVQMLKIGSAAMREEAAKLGFKINIIGPSIGGADIAYLNKLWSIDNNFFSYMDTLAFHMYIRYSPSQCDAFGSSKLRCIETFDEVRKYMNAHGGTNVHLATTEGGTAGDQGTCLGPQVRSEEQQSTINTENLLWLRGRPYLKFDFWITTNPFDNTDKYSFACDSGIYDIPYWEYKLGVFRADLTIKPWGIKYRDLVAFWR